MSIVSYPTPLYQNPAIEPEFYSPQRYNISAVSFSGQTITVTTSVDNEFVVGQLIRMIIPTDYGCRQLNNVQGYVLSKPDDDEVLLDIPSYNVDAFADPGTGAGAQILAIGDINSGQISSTGNTNQVTYVPGAFINISPQ